MYAIVEIAGKQFRVEEKRRLRVPLLDVESGKKVEFDNILVYNDDKNVQIGKPIVNKVIVTATVIEHNREKKIVIFKKKRRKGYQKKNGHRQDYSLIMVDKIGAGSITKSAKSKKVEAKPVTEAAKKATAVKPALSEKKQAKPKTAAKAKVETKPKETAAKKTTTKAAAKPKATKPKTTAKKATAKPKAATKAKAEPKDKKE